MLFELLRKLLTVLRAGTSYTEIRLDATGFSLVEPAQPPMVVKWSDVVAVAVYKNDAITSDVLCMEIQSRDTRSVEVCEDDAGFWELDSAMAGILPGYRADWPRDVLKPAFTPSRTVLFER